MLEIEKWGQDKPIGLVVFAQQAAISAEACYEVCRMARDSQYIDSRSLMPPLERWVELYRDPAAMIQVLRDCVNIGGDDPLPSMQEGLEGIVALQHLDDTERARLLEGMTHEELNEGIVAKLQEMEGEYSDYLRMMDAEIKGEGGISDGLAEILSTPEVLFFFRVWCPCWLEYGQHLPDLLSSAEGGNYDAIEKLLRLDALALEHPKIREQYYTIQNEGRKLACEDLAKALAEEPEHNLSIGKIKVILGALILRVFKKADKKCRELEKKWGWKRPKLALTAPKVQALFDAVAKDVRNEERDLDLPESPEAFYIALWREREFWERLL